MNSSDVGFKLTGFNANGNSPTGSLLAPGKPTLRLNYRF
jgi:hypothetical protein